MRSYSPAKLIGGAEVLLSHAPYKTQLNLTELNLLQAQKTRNILGALTTLMQLQKVPQNLNTLAEFLDVSPQEIASFLEEQSTDELSSLQQKCANSGKNRDFTSKDLAHTSASAPEKAKQTQWLKLKGVQAKAKPFYLGQEQSRLLLGHIEKQLKDFHKENPHQRGISQAALQELTKTHMSSDAFSALINYAAEHNLLLKQDGLISHPHAQYAVQAQEKKRCQCIYKRIVESGLSSPFTKELSESLNLPIGQIKQGLRLLTEQEKLVKIDDEYFVDKEQLSRAQTKLVNLLSQQDFASVSELRQCLGLSRKFTLPLLGYFDAQGLTIREGELRSLKSNT